MVLSVPSYVIPGTYGENVVFLAGRSEIQAIEFLFYTFDAESRDLFTREKPLIASYWQRFSYAVHMPDRLLPEHELLIELTRDLCDRYILHPPPGDLNLEVFSIEEVNELIAALGEAGVLPQRRN